jgi:hypothetical protein
MARRETGRTGSAPTLDRDDKRDWCSPELRELGNLTDFVQSGNAFGKSSTHSDGMSMPGGEAKDH